MVRPIRFPLEMKDGVRVRTIEELRSNFDLERVLEYYIDGKLVTWLKHRYYEKEAREILLLDNNLEDFQSNICHVLGVQEEFSEPIDFAVIVKKYLIKRNLSVECSNERKCEVDEEWVQPI